MSFFTYLLAAFVLLLTYAIMVCLAILGRGIAEETPEPQQYRIVTDQQYILCGKGYKSQEDNITMTSATTLRPGGLYVHLSGDVYKCLRTASDGCAVLMDINSGTLLTVRSVRAYQDGKIDYQIVECVRLAGAAV